jgi:hypothetical protein
VPAGGDPGPIPNVGESAKRSLVLLAKTIPEFMPHNRLYERSEFSLSALKASLTDVTRTARQWDATYAMRVSADLLGKYTVPNVTDDDEGHYLVGALVQVIDAALDGRVQSRRVSYGNFLALDIAFRAQHRRTSGAEVLQLRAVLGPCDGDHPVVCVVRLDPPLPRQKMLNR